MGCAIAGACSLAAVASMIALDPVPLRGEDISKNIAVRVVVARGKVEPRPPVPIPGKSNSGTDTPGTNTNAVALAVKSSLPVGTLLLPLPADVAWTLVLGETFPGVSGGVLGFL